MSYKSYAITIVRKDIFFIGNRKIFFSFLLIKSIQNKAKRYYRLKIKYLPIKKSLKYLSLLTKYFYQASSIIIHQLQSLCPSFLLTVVLKSLSPTFLKPICRLWLICSVFQVYCCRFPECILNRFLYPLF